MTPDEFHAEMRQYPISTDLAELEGFAPWMTAVEGLLASLFAEAHRHGIEIEHHLRVGNADRGISAGGMPAFATDADHFDNCFRRVGILLWYRFGIDVSQDHRRPPDDR